jgi:hypothetical protein
MPKVFPNTTKAFFSVDLNDGEKLSFGSFENIREWISKEQRDWHWLLQVRGDELGQPLEEWRRSFARAFNQMNKKLEEWEQNPTDKEPAAVLRKTLVDTYSGASKVIRSDNPIAKIGKEIANSSGPLSALAGVAFLLDVPIRTMNTFATVGILKAILLRDGIDKKTPDVVMDHIQRLTDANQTPFKRRLDELAEREKSADTFLKESKAQFDRDLQENSQRCNELIAKIKGQADDALTSIRATDAAFSDQMKLQASVNYWRERAKSQGTQTRHYLLILAAFVVLVIIVGWWSAATYVPQLLTKDIGKQPEAYVVALTLTLLFCTVAFWAARVMVRLYLSAHHLVLDAWERTVMIQTYLALIKEDKLAPEERALVLTPLFRSSADGIIKDEGAPDLSVAALFSRLLAKP